MQGDSQVDSKEPKPSPHDTPTDSASLIPWGTVVVTRGRHRGRIGYYDNDYEEPVNAGHESEELDDTNEYQDLAVVYWGPAFRSSHSGLPHDSIAPATVQDLLDRMEVLERNLRRYAFGEVQSVRTDKMTELLLIERELTNRMLYNRTIDPSRRASVFISHSSADKHFARWLRSDLSNSGHRPWLDEAEIAVGESIPTKLQDAIRESDAVALVLSDNAVKSNWVEREWQAKYWEEVQAGDVRVLPLLLEDCEIPSLLHTKKYADFRTDYNDGMKQLIEALDGLRACKSEPA